MKLDYVYHNGFAIEADDVIVIIDYYKDISKETPSRGTVRNCLLKKSGMLYVLSSYLHPDHLNRKVFPWKEEHLDIRYIFSKDILKHRCVAAEDTAYINEGDAYEDGHIRIETLGSVNVGISFLVDLQGIRLFHTGDLSNWHWSEESTPQKICETEGDFLTEIKILQRKAPLVDVAMFPVDSRIGRDYVHGAEQLVERIKTTIFAPIYFNEDYRGGNSSHAFAKSKGCRLLAISRRGESFDVTK